MFGFNRHRGHGITVGADYSSPEGIMATVDRLPKAQRLAVLAALFPGVLPPVQHAAIGAREDIDGDGKLEDVFDQWCPLTGVAGKSIAAAATENFEITPQRLFKPGILTAVARVVAIEDLMVSNVTIGIEPQLVSSGVVPLAAFQHDSVYKLLSSHWAGPGVPIRFDVTNTAASGTAKVFGLWFGDSVVRTQ